MGLSLPRAEMCESRMKKPARITICAGSGRGCLKQQFPDVSRAPRPDNSNCAARQFFRYITRLRDNIRISKRKAPMSAGTCRPRLRCALPIACMPAFFRRRAAKCKERQVRLTREAAEDFHGRQSRHTRHSPAIRHKVGQVCQGVSALFFYFQESSQSC